MDFDIAASTPFCSKKLFVSYEPTTMSLAMGDITNTVEGMETVKFYFDSKNGRNNITLHSVQYSPKLRKNLMSGPVCIKIAVLLWEVKEKLRFSMGMEENCVMLEGKNNTTH
ncbi:hypothetical protein TNCV_3205611 [Trichonephila clavipes]|nr:hypothetical protein TNCV_3205611 [Trichonephila clavipes]